MKIEQDTDLRGNIIRGYAPGEIRINEQRYHASLIVTPEQVIPDWPPAAFEDLAAEHFQTVVELAPEIVVVGTGDTHRFPRPAILAALYRRGIGVEVMSTEAACRTYNILMAEDRPVAAALLMTSVR